MSQKNFQHHASQGYDMTGLPVGRVASLRDYLFNHSSIIALMGPGLIMHSALEMGGMRVAALVGGGAVVGISMAFNQICRSVDRYEPLRSVVRGGTGKTLDPAQLQLTQHYINKVMFDSLQPAAIGLVGIMAGGLPALYTQGMTDVPAYMQGLRMLGISVTFGSMAYMVKMLGFGMGIGFTRPSTLRQRIT